MPRTARQREEQGLHHIVVQGKRREHIFALDSDKELYIDTLLRYKEKTQIRLYAYCILDNHLHVVLQETEEEDVSSFMRRVGVSYAYWYRAAHPERQGGKAIFRGRYMSEPLQSEQELLEAVRYIHQEPVRQGLVSHMEDYPWSSYRLYITGDSLIDSRLLLDSLHFGGGYAAYMQEETREEKHFLEEVPLRYGRSDEEAREALQRELERRGVKEVRELESDEVKNMLRTLHFQEEISIQQLARITGIGRGLIQRLK